MPRIRDDVAKVVCPYCRERVELFVDPETSGSFVEDCAVCCRPWSVQVSVDEDGNRRADVLPAQ
ncbi:MAG: CPXCG motif-containing cysteine-rich protein [Myxococcota bacterium]|jgi:Cysteine-rich CPXCG|nr:CPXCG motif-containing cysteine-rich protein [Myxococcota bacterium]